MTTTSTRDQMITVVDSARLRVRGSLRELYRYREAVWSFGVRGFRIRYKQAALGVLWVVLQPLAFLTIFVVFFGHVAKVSGAGSTYAAFALSALVPWQFLSSAVSFGSNALITDNNLLRKVYFPREAPVLGSIGSFLPDLAIGLVLLGLAIPFTHARVTWTVVYTPILVVGLLLVALAIALPTAALSVHYRDFKYALGFFVQVWLFASPVAYPVTRISEGWRTVYAIGNPAVGVLDGFRHVLAVGDAPDWSLLLPSMAAAVLLLLPGYALFKRLERDFADIV